MEILFINCPFTTTQWEIIKHRLEVPHAIVDVMTDDNPELDADKLKYDIELLEVFGHEWNEFSEQQHAIIRECCAGSTFFAGIDDAVACDELTPGMRDKYIRAANWLERVLDVKIPRG